jgi:hypothetical protein
MVGYGDSASGLKGGGSDAMADVCCPDVMWMEKVLVLWGDYSWHEMK